MHVCGRFLLAVASVLVAACAAFSADHDPVDQPLYDIVAVGRGPGKIFLGTLATPGQKGEWRFREIRISPSDGVPRDVVLSADGTKALVVFSDGTPHVFDLTQRITGIGAASPSPSQHRLSKQLFPFASDGEVCLVDDLGGDSKRDCTHAADAVIADDGRVLYALSDGRLILRAPDGSEPEQLPYRLPRRAQCKLLAGFRGDAQDFLVLVTETQQASDGKPTGSVTRIIDPRLPAIPLGQFSSPTVAALRAQLSFAGSMARSSKAALTMKVDDSTLATLAAHLAEETHDTEIAWSFYRVTLNEELYAPVLEFARGEPDYPSDVDIWQEIRPLAHGTSRESYEAAYASMEDRRWSRCIFYVSTMSYPGTWLIEYWFYYPFDEGRPHPHIHDSEHLFVEVDKLGGTVRNVFASDHDSFVPNDLYSTLVKDAPPVTLPLFSTVELGKHAMAPDLDHDGRFTRGVDDNLHRELYSFWGLRDRGNKIHFLMEPYTASMSLPRDRTGRFALRDAADIFPGLDVPADHEVCGLRPFPDDPPCPHCDPGTTAAGITHLVDHPDARVPENIYKPYVLPWREVRVGVGIYDWAAGREQLTLSYVGDFSHMTGGLLPAPARLGLEYSWSPRGIYVPMQLGGHVIYTYSKPTMWAGVRVERLVTNTQGFYFDVTPEWADVSLAFTDGAALPAASHWRYSGLSYHAGYLIELPSAHKGNFTNQIGVSIQDAPGHPILFEWRVSFGFLRRRGRHDFGARLGDRNPYE